MNSHLVDYLGYYKSLSKPGYAVLVTGVWGSGKTFQVKQILPKEERYYISLFGLQTADDVHAAVLAEMDPTFAKVQSVVASAGDVANGFGAVGKLFGAIPNLVNSVIRQDMDVGRTIVFDDLERCGLDLKNMLGIVNTYVERHECRVIVIAHDEKIIDKFKEQKEKIFGQTLKVVPQVEDAFDAFAAQFFKDVPLGFIETYRPDILEIYEMSGVGSLRILKHLIEDMGRLYKTLKKFHVDHAEAMRELISLVSIFDIEIRYGRLDAESIRTRLTAGINFNENEKTSDGKPPPKPPLLTAIGTYKKFNLRSTLLSEELLFQMLVNGHYDQQAIQAALNNSPYFIKVDDASPWKIILNFADMAADAVAKAIDEMQTQFDTRSVTDSGEMLHIFSLRMMLSENGEPLDDIATVVTDCKKYVDDLLEQNLLPVRELDDGWAESFEGSYDGHRYWGGDHLTMREEVRELYQYIISAREEALEKEFPQIAVVLMQLMKTDMEAFHKQMCFSVGCEPAYWSIPILSHIKAQDFVDGWLGLPKECWRKVAKTLYERYNSNFFINGLEAEKKWAHQVVQILEAEASKMSGIEAFRIQRMILNIMRPKVDQVQ
ncbi:MAG: hypothetical protein JKY92_02590 [Magnetovibrio sp.]|nr:hypothetical protein [Magnetovibrio sp.]